MNTRQISRATPSSHDQANEGVREGVNIYPKSGFFAKVSPSGVVNTLHNQTNISFRNFLMGFLNGSPLNFRNAARFARVKCQVQSEDFLCERFLKRKRGEYERYNACPASLPARARIMETLPIFEIGNSLINLYRIIHYSQKHINKSTNPHCFFTSKFISYMVVS